jgi:UDP-N-acetylmuramyl tripeptide synthase
MENAVAAVTVANQIGVELETCAAALKTMKGSIAVARFMEIKMEFG